MHFLRLYVAPGALIFVTGINAQTGQCYFPGGVQRAFGWEPCVDFVEQSICCPTGWTCFSNKLCVATDPSVVNSTVPLGSTRRGACTNPSGNTTVCGDFCQNEPVNDNEGDLVACGDNNYCCGPEAASGLCNCDTGVGTFNAGSGTAQTIIGITGLANTATPTVQPSSAFATTSPTTSSTSTSQPPESSSSATSTHSTSTSSSTTTSTATALSATTSSTSSSHLGLKVGIPVGIIGGLALIGFFLWLWRECIGSSKYDPETDGRPQVILNPEPMQQEPHVWQPASNRQQYPEAPNSLFVGAARVNNRGEYDDEATGLPGRSNSATGPGRGDSHQSQPWRETPVAQRLNAATVANQTTQSEDTGLGNGGLGASANENVGYYRRVSPAVPRGHQALNVGGDEAVSPIDEEEGGGRFSR